MSVHRHAHESVSREDVQFDGIIPTRDEFVCFDVPRCLCPPRDFSAFDSHVEEPTEQAHFGRETAGFDVCFNKWKGSRVDVREMENERGVEMNL